MTKQGNFLGVFSSLLLGLALVPATAHAQFLTTSKYTHAIDKHLADGTADGELYNGGEVESAVEMVYNNAGNLLVSSYGQGTISEITSSGTVVGTLVSGLGDLYGLAYNPNTGDIYAVAGSEVHRYDSLGGFLGSQSLSTNGTDVILTSGGTILVSEGSNIREYDLGLGLIGNFATVSGNARGMTFDSSGNLYVADESNGSVEVFNNAGGSLGTLISGIDTPYALAIDPGTNSIYATSFNASRVYGFDLSTGAPTFDFQTSSGLGGTWGIVATSTATAAPEPGTLALLLLGGGAAVAIKRRKK